MPTVRVPILNLFSGVARQPSSKRLTSELENIENAILTLERSAEKRPPLEFIHGGGAGGFLSNSLFISDKATNLPDDIAYFFFDKNEIERYVIIVNRNVPHGSTDMIKIFKFKEVVAGSETPAANSPMLGKQKVRAGDCIIEEVFSPTQTQDLDFTKVNGQAAGYINYDANTIYEPVANSGVYIDDIWEYVKYNPGNKPARDTLKATFFGNAVMVLNKQVPATTWTGADLTTNASGSSTHVLGKKLTYRVAAAPPSVGDYILGGTYNTATDQHEPVGGCAGTHPIQLFLGADGNGVIQISDFQANNVSDPDYGLAVIKLAASTIVTDLGSLVTALNTAYVDIVDNATGQSSLQGPNGVQTYLGTFSLDTEGGANTGKLKFTTQGRGSGNSTGQDIVQFFDGETNTATHLGLSGLNSTFDQARTTGKNLQPILAATDASAGTTSAPRNSFGGNGGTNAVTIKGGSDTSTWTPSATADFGALKSSLNSLAGKTNYYDLKLNSAKTGFFLVYGSAHPTGTAGYLVDEVSESQTNGVAKRLGFLYSIGQHIPVREDKSESTDLFQTELGQNISSFNAIEIPPVGDDVTRANGEEAAIKALYEKTGVGDSEGRGKVWYCRSGFLTFPQGFYRTTSNDTIPHYSMVRSEDEHSVLYEPSLPFLIVNAGDNTWEVQYPNWTPREAGNSKNNPGPQAFKPDLDNNVKGRTISSIAFWRERLWFTSADMVFSSRSNDWFNLYLEDPNQITSDDPIDIRASSGKYTRINFMIPFDDFMFINTGGETQYELQGSNNVISPTTAELAPTSFYSASDIIEPLVLGTQIYWFDDERLYLYNSSAGASVNNATEVSIHAAGYLPKNYRCAAVAPAQDSIFVVDEDNPDTVYVYTARWSGGELAQNAFYKYKLPQTVVNRQITDAGNEHTWDTATYWDGTNTTLPKPEIEYLWYSRNYLYMIVLRPAYSGSKMQRFVERTSLQFLDINTPRLDRLVEIPNTYPTNDANDNNTEATWYSSGKTYWRLPYWDPSAGDIVLGPDWPTQAGQHFGDATVDNNEEHTSNCTVLNVSGDWNSVSSTAYSSRAGSSYTMLLEMSQINYRDPGSGLPVEGTLALRMMNVRHFKTGVYDVELRRGNRNNIGSEDANADGTKDKVTRTTHSPLSLNNSEDALGSLLVEGEGEFSTRVLGNADTTNIRITSNYPSPCAITSIEFIGKFKPYNSSIQS